MRSETVRYHPVASHGVSGLYFPQTRRSSNRTIHGDPRQPEAPDGRRRRKEGSYIWRILWKHQKLTAPLSWSRNTPILPRGLFTYWTMGRELGGRNLQLFIFIKNRRNAASESILIAVSLVKLFVQIPTIQSEEWVTSAFQYCLLEVEGLSSPHHKSLSTLGCLDRPWQSSQKGLYCEWSLSDSECYPLQKGQKSDQHVGFPCPER